MANERFVPHSHVSYGDPGIGVYSSHTQAVTRAAEGGTGMILSALKRIADHTKKDLYTICDYGTADGGNSMNVIRKCIAQLKVADPNVEVQVWYEDQHTNDFKSLFNRLHGIIPHPPTYLNDYRGIYIGAIATQFYEQCVPSGSVDLAIATTCTHWLSKRPCTLKKTLAHLLSDDETERRLFTEQAANDWVTFLMLRAAELAPGGQAVCIMLAIDKDGQYPGKTKRTEESTYEVMSTILQSMADDGIITKEEFINTNFNFYIRTTDEVIAPFQDEDSPVWKAGLRLVSMETSTIPCPVQEQWINNARNDDIYSRQNSAAKYVKSTRVWSNHSIFSGLSQSRPEKERREIVDAFYARFEDIVAICPERYGLGIPYIYLHVEKSPP